LQLRSNLDDTPFRSLEITSREDLHNEIECLQNIMSGFLNSMGLSVLEVTAQNCCEVTQMFPPHGAFLLGRLCTLIQLQHELYGEDRVLPWIKKPSNN
jgi:hypothetical protein